MRKPQTAIPAGRSGDQANLWALLNTVEFGILLLSPDQRVEYCNTAFLRIWRLPMEPDMAGVVGMALDTLDRKSTRLNSSH